MDRRQSNTIVRNNPSTKSSERISVRRVVEKKGMSIYFRFSMQPPKKTTTSENEKDALIALPLNKCLAKTYTRTSGDKSAGRLVLNHCEIVASVAREIILRMPCWMQNSLFPPGSELVAGAHDIGKVSPTFQEKIYRGTKDYTWNSFPELKGITPDLESGWGGHAGVSQVTAQSIQVGKYILPRLV